ncbi:MAG: cytochrome C oxidase subunit IV family protein [Blastocatellia bacterium]|jgi:cytochrome c oxidase subunit 4
MSEHVVTPKVYVSVFLALMVLTVLTVIVAYFDLKQLNVIIALGIAIIKASLVVLFFMHVRWSSTLTKVFVIAGLFWLVIMVSLTLSDYLTRPSWSPTLPGPQ